MYGHPYEEEEQYFSSQGEYNSEACKEYARNHGRFHPEIAWISTPMDSWEANPFYIGPKVSHPEADDDFDDDDCGDAAAPLLWSVLLDDEIPF